MGGAGGRRALSSCLRALAAAQGSAACSTSARCVPPLADASTSYAVAQPGWAQRRGTSSSSSAAARGGSGGGPTVVAIAQRWQHSGAAAAVASPRQAVYQVVVVTGDVRGAGSAAPAVVTLVGSGAGGAGARVEERGVHVVQGGGCGGMPRAAHERLVDRQTGMLGHRLQRCLAAVALPPARREQPQAQQPPLPSAALFTHPTVT